MAKYATDYPNLDSDSCLVQNKSAEPRPLAPTIGTILNALRNPLNRPFPSRFGKNKGVFLGSAKGRGTTWFVQGDNGAYALRHYYRGGLWGKVVKDKYHFTGWENTRAYQELMLLNQLREHQVNVPQPIAAKVTRSRWTYRADILISQIPNAKDLVGLLSKHEISPELYQDIGGQIRKMHDANINHTDLNIHNILIDAHNKVWIIDFDKCYQQVGEGWKGDNMARLKRSFEKEQKIKGIYWIEDNWSQIRTGYKNR